MATIIGIDYLSCPELLPTSAVHLAADLGCSAFGISLDPYAGDLRAVHGRSLRDPVLQRETRDAMRARGIVISMCEGFMVAPEINITDRAGDLDILGELEVPVVNIFSLDPDRSRTLDQLGAFVELTSGRGLQATVEFLPGSPIQSLSDACGVVEQIGAPNLKILVDFMHLCRTGGTAADLAALASAQVGYVQVCDIPIVPVIANYGEEALFNRLPLGEGELPLRELINALPREVAIGVEIPMSNQGLPPFKRLASSIAFLRDILSDESPNSVAIMTSELHKTSEP